MTIKVWDNCNKWIGITVRHKVRHKAIDIHFQNFYLLCYNEKVNDVWKGMWITVVWKIWKLRNKVVFNNDVVDDLEIFP